MLVETLTNGNETLEIHSDEASESPREWDNLGTMVCFHRRYNLGDKHNFSIEDADRIEANSDRYISLPIYMYDHSGLTINTTGFSCQWDSGKLGIIFVDKKKVREVYGWKVISPKRKAQILEYLVNEVKTYDQYIRGEVYGFKKFVDGEEGDSCWGFFGYDHRDSGLFDEAGWKYEPKTNKEKHLEKLGK